MEETGRSIIIPVKQQQLQQQVEYSIIENNRKNKKKYNKETTLKNPKSEYHS